jgi:serine/threonine protein kinase
MNDVLRDGRFVALGPLGEGSQGKTLDGMDKREGRPVAIKRFDVRGAKGWKDVELAEREARVLSSLSHPKLPAYVDHFEQEGALYLVMEKIEGESLAAIRKRGAILGEEDVFRFLTDAAEVLRYLHSRAPAVIHRDLKPGNVIRRPDGSFAFVDFGAVRDKLKPEGGSTVVGTFGYMAPEQFQGRALPASDVYAIGATAITMLTGEDPENLPHKGLAIDVRAALRGRASERTINVLEQMLDPDPDRRASSLSKLLEVQRPRVAEKKSEERDPRRRDERRARREARRARRHGGPPRPIPKPVALFLSLGIALGAAITWIALVVVTRAILGTLSIFFGRKMLVAADAVYRGAVATMVAMRAARERVMHGFAPPRAEEVRVRVEAEHVRARVADETMTEQMDEEVEPARKQRKKV